MAFYSNISGYSFKDRGVLPDHEVKNSIADVVSGKDAVMEYAVNLIESKKK